MKNIILGCLCIVLFSNCSGNDDMETVIQQTEEVEVGSMNESAFLMGDFVNRAHPTSGKASVNSDKTIVSFTNFKTDDGPKLLVYLSTDVNSSEFVNLGDLKEISGDFKYSIPTNTDLSKYKFVNIWCVDFLVSFGTAELK